MVNKFTEKKTEDARNTIKKFLDKFRFSILWNKLIGYFRKWGKVLPTMYELQATEIWVGLFVIQLVVSVSSVDNNSSIWLIFLVLVIFGIDIIAVDTYQRIYTT